MSIFVAAKGDGHPTELAMLRGARLVMAQETEPAQCWAESRIKTLTVGDPIAARFVRQDFFTFVPACKLVFAGNHRPSLRHVGEAMRRRFHLVPCTVVIPEVKRDRELSEKLKAEWPGILAWAIEGCLEWQRIGFAPPDAVRAVTKGYLGDEDFIGRFLEERCVDDPASIHLELQVLFNAWHGWCVEAGEAPGSHKGFSRALKERGYSRIKHPKTRRACFAGIRLREHN
jgi:putative DNA primase/helicase